MYPKDYFQYLRAIRDNKTLSSNAKLVALMIASHHEFSSDKQAFPSVDLLATETGISRASVYRAKLELTNNGWLESTRRFNNSNLYSFAIPTSHSDTTIVSHRDVQRSHSEALNTKINTKLNTNISSFAAMESEVISQEEELFVPESFVEELALETRGTSIPLDYLKYITPDISLVDIKEEVEDKDIYFLIVKLRKEKGIF